MKQIIRLNERDLRNMISESVSRILNEWDFNTSTDNDSVMGDENYEQSLVAMLAHAELYDFEYNHINRDGADVTMFLSMPDSDNCLRLDAQLEFDMSTERNCDGTGEYGDIRNNVWYRAYDLENVQIMDIQLCVDNTDGAVEDVNDTIDVTDNKYAIKLINDNVIRDIRRNIEDYVDMYEDEDESDYSEW